MEHESFIEALEAYRDGELAAADRARVDGHLAGCPSCRRRLSELDRLARALLVRPAVPSEAFVRRVMAALPQEDAEEPGWGWWAPSFGFAAAALLLALWLPRRETSVSTESVLLAGLPQTSASDDPVGSLLDAR